RIGLRGGQGAASNASRKAEKTPSRRVSRFIMELSPGATRFRKVGFMKEMVAFFVPKRYADSVSSYPVHSLGFHDLFSGSLAVLPCTVYASRAPFSESAMSEAESNPSPTPDSNESEATRQAPAFSIRNVLMLAIPLALIVGGVGGWMYYQAKQEE